MPPEPEPPEMRPPPPPPVPPPHSTLVTRSMTLVPVRGARDGEPVAPAAFPLPLPPEVDDGLLAARSVNPLMRFDSSALARSTTPWLVMMVAMSPWAHYRCRDNSSPSPPLQPSTWW